MEITEDHLLQVVGRPHREVEVPAVETQMVVVLAEGTHRAVEVPAVVARRPQGARQPKHASTTKIKTEIGVTRHQQKDGALDYFFESCDSYHLFVILFVHHSFLSRFRIVSNLNKMTDNSTDI